MFPLIKILCKDKNRVTNDNIMTVLPESCLEITPVGCYIMFYLDCQTSYVSYSNINISIIQIYFNVKF